MEVTVKFANFFKVPVSNIKRFDALEARLAMQRDHPTDKNIIAVVDMMNAVDADDRGFIRGKIQVWIEEVLNNIKTST